MQDGAPVIFAALGVEDVSQVEGLAVVELDGEPGPLADPGAIPGAPLTIQPGLPVTWLVAPFNVRVPEVCRSGSD